MAYSVNISIEAPIENQIQEIKYDGEEIYQAPLSLSENLSRLAQKIDFTKTDDEYFNSNVKKENENSSESKIDEETKDPGIQSSLWPWDSVRNKLRNALTEVCVLADVLAIAKEKRYMVLDPVQPIEQENRPIVQVYGRKKALGAAASVLLAGAERLRAGENHRASRNAPDFHIDLLRLRQNWRLKKVSNTIVGDLSYRTAGSKFSQTGVFEVTKAPEDAPATTPSNASGPPPSALRVTVPPELQGVGFISVLCQKEQDELVTTPMCRGPVVETGAELHWQQRLEAAQNVLFCKELFSRLAAEAVQLDATIPHVVVGNQIMASVLPGIKLLIGLCHSNGKNNTNIPDGSPFGLLKQIEPTVSTGKPDHDHVLEHSLHQLLRQLHHDNTHRPFPHPASGPLGPSEKRSLAGPMAADRYELLEMSKEQTLLEQIIQQAQHFFMRRRTEYVLDTIAKEVKDPLIVSHWNALSNATLSCVKINIMAHGYDAVCRTSLVVHVGQRTLKCICRDGRVRHMSYELQELRDLIFCQIYRHQMTAVQAVARCMGWTLAGGTAHVGTGPPEPLSNASACLLVSPNGDRMISIRSEPSTGIQVSIASSPRSDLLVSELVPDRKWENLGGPFRELKLDKMEGKNFLNKMELLMACLSTNA